jgi:hypothetical protein
MIVMTLSRWPSLDWQLGRSRDGRPKGVEWLELGSAKIEPIFDSICVTVLLSYLEKASLNVNFKRLPRIKFLIVFPK